MAAARPHVVIVGGGFGGLWAARSLRRASVHVTLVDRRNHHLFLPLLYQVATAGLNPGDIAAPIRRVLRRQANATVLLGEAAAVDLDGRRVLLGDGAALAYDALILAAGSRHDYFGHDEWAAVAPGLTTVEDALDLRRRVLLAYEAAEREEDEGRRAAWLTCVVIGGGPTGVELAGALAEMARHALAGEFRRIDPRAARVILLEGLDRVLPSYPPDLSVKARRSLQRLGVEVRTGARVGGIDEDGVRLAEERIDARCVFWAAGVSASPLSRSLGAPLDRMGRVLVQRDLSVPGRPEILVIGDMAAVPQAGGGFAPALAPCAMQQGRLAARNVVRRLRGLPGEPFRYRDRGRMATIGRSAAVADFGRVRLSGWIAWAAWLAVHIVFLIGFRSRLLVLAQWTWAYWTYDRGVRLVTGEARNSRPAGALTDRDRRAERPGR